MIISLKYNYIYIRTRKTGSTSIEDTLREHLGPDDIVLHTRLDALRPVMKPGIAATRWEGDILTHAPISKIRPLLRDDIWDRLFKFTSERHPYERAMSLAHYRVRQMHEKNRSRRHERSSDFPALLDHIVRLGKYSTFRLYAIDGRPVVDDFVKLETLDADMQRIGARLCIPLPEKMPRRRETPRDDPRPAREVLTQEQRDIVYEHCRPEFELLGYAR
jgi:hypothetical protein